MKPKFTEEERKLIGRRIRDSRNAEKYTLEQLAEIIGCSPKHLGDVERGTVSASWPLAVKIGKALNTGVDYYLADTSDQYFDIQIDLEISNILKDCDMEGRMTIRDTARRICKRSMAELEHRLPEEKSMEQELADRFKGQEELTNEMALAFIDAVYILPGSQVEIRWKFKDPLAENED